MKLVTKTIPHIGKKQTATVIFLHGSGDNGHNLIEWIRILLGRDLQHPHIKFVYPTAPVQPYTPLNGAPSNVWFDRNAITIGAKENVQSLSSIYDSIKELIQNEIDQGIQAERIIIGGFSMGGALAMHTGYLLNTNLAGVFACSSFLNRDSIVYTKLKEIQQQENQNLPELLMFHGDRDTLVPPTWGQETYNELTKLGVKGEYILLKNALHELKKKELLTLEEWILNKLKPDSDDTSKSKY